MMAVIGTFSYNFQVILPLLASFTWHGTASTYTALAVAMGVGSVIGALAAGARGRVGPRLLVTVGVRVRRRPSCSWRSRPTCRCSCSR